MRPICPKTIQQVSCDLYSLIRQFSDHQDVASMNSFKLLERILDEQCLVEGCGDDCQVMVKEPKQIPSDSLQNPSDPDASYSGHKGQGYQVQIMKTYTDTEDKEQKALGLNILRAAVVMAAMFAPTPQQSGPKGGYCAPISVFKERFWAAALSSICLAAAQVL
jgi:hypothetical protein